ncbi:MAG: Ig-like domain-containing protein, partial [Candidatus Cryptobacteroides sp.]
QTKKLSVTTDNTEGAVTYSIDKTEIATVAEDGTVTPVAEGEATVTVKVAAAGMYSEAEATAKITVTAASTPVTGPRYVKVASAQEDWSGKYLIVFGTNAHATLAEGSKDLNPTAEVTIADDSITSDETVDAAALTISKNGDKYIMAFADGKYFAMQHNGCLLSTEPFDLDFGYTESGIEISGYVSAKSATYILYANGTYYRCYVNKTGTSGYSLPTLYKYEE